MRRHVQDQFDAYLTETLAPEARRDLEQHVEGCRTCGEALEEARTARAYLQCLVSAEAPPEPAPDFYLRVRESIERKQVSGWFGSLSIAPYPRLAYPLLFLGFLLMAWTLTLQRGEREEGLLAMEFPSTLFASMSFSEANQSLSHDYVMISLVEVSDNEED